MHSKMQIYAEILRQIGRMPNDYKEPDMDDMERAALDASISRALDAVRTGRVRVAADVLADFE